MVGSLSELFGKNFLIGYFLPALMIVVAAVQVFDASGITTISKPILSYVSRPLAPASAGQLSGKAAKSKVADVDAPAAPIGQIGLLLSLAALLAVFLLATNYSITRFFEGYGPLNPFRPMRRWQVSRFNRLRALIASDGRSANQETPHTRQHSLARVITFQWRRLTARLVSVPNPDSALRNATRDVALYYPEDEGDVLPTQFGNIMRAFERYPQVIYWIEPIHTWARLEPLIPEPHRELLQDAKSQIDFWLNSWFGALAVAFLLACMHTFTPDKEPSVLVPVLGARMPYGILLALFVGYLCAKRAHPAAIQYGLLVKSAFDLYRADLCAKLGLSMPQAIGHERLMWQSLAWIMLYRNADAAGDLTRFRRAETDKLS